MTDDPFRRVFRTAGLRAMVLLRAEHAASGLPFDQWVQRRRAAHVETLRTRQRLDALLGAGTYRWRKDGTVAVKRDGHWVTCDDPRVLEVLAPCSALI